jgi:3-hydroxyacyl-CoA dehydrogenase/enoyl-CoA hydratase/3-hydroxybutyryl-CoA epimerase
VFENPELKAKITKMAEDVISADAVFGSNTSTLPITGLAEASQRPENFIGIHFFSPVERMGLVEIITGEKTSEETLAKSVDYVLAIRKTPIVVNDSRGFYTSRCFGTYTQEGMAMLAEGIKPAIIENVGRQSGMPMGAQQRPMAIILPRRTSCLASMKARRCRSMRRCGSKRATSSTLSNARKRKR